jgi:glycosyltransferase involved in cell wall biosynthesis
LAKDLGIDSRVTFLDFRRDIGKLMRAVDLFIFPSRYEAGTIALLEALASGLPAVTARTTGGCEVMGNAAGKIIDDPNDADALAAAIRTLADDESARRTAAAEARAVAEKYSWTSMAQQYLELFEESVQRPQVGSAR